MLRSLSGDSPRLCSGLQLEANEAMSRFMEYAPVPAGKDIHSDKRKNSSVLNRQVWAYGFIRSLDELEQSMYASEKYGQSIDKTYLEQMKPDERGDYDLFLYYYKNAFIRVFALLDKLGFFINNQLDLRTEDVKEHFSFFTVLRQMHETNRHTKLEHQLFELKEKFQTPMGRLRILRNQELHSMNVEMINDFQTKGNSGSIKTTVENIDSYLADLRQGFDMVAKSLKLTFQHLTPLRKTGQ